jgi:uncharacterized damage-inducible protein DinB
VVRTVGVEAVVTEPAGGSRIIRTDPAGTLPEKPMLMAYLDYHRQTLARKLDGLSGEQAIARSTVSGLTLLGIVRHLTEVERGWINEDFAGQDLPPLYSRPGAPDADFDELDGAGLDADLAAWRDQIADTDGIVADHELGTTVQHGRMGDISLRWILLHLIEEYARHNGHADIIREAIDGAVGE